MLKKHAVIITLLLIILSGACLRFYKLGDNSLWLDEAGSFYTANESFADVINLVSGDTPPPGYFVTLSYFIKLFGPSEAVLRLPSAIAGVFAIFAMFLLGRRLYSNKEGLIAAALTAVMSFQLFISREARSYSMLMLFTALSFYFLIPIIRSLSDKKAPAAPNAALYIIAAVVTSYLHYFGTFIVILQALTMLWLARQRLKNLIYVLLVCLAIAACFAPWLPFLISQYHNSLSHVSWIGKPGPMAFLDYLYFIYNDNYPIFLFVLVMYGVFLGHFFYKAAKQKLYKTGFSLTDPDFLLLCWLLVPFIIVFIKSHVSFPILTPKYLTILCPAAYLMLARAIGLMPFNNLVSMPMTVILVYACLYNTVITNEYYMKPSGPNAQYRQAAGLIQKYEPVLKNTLIAAYMEDLTTFKYYFKTKDFRKNWVIVEQDENAMSKVLKRLSDEKPDYLWVPCSFFLRDKVKVANLGPLYKSGRVILDEDLYKMNLKLIKLKDRD